MHEEQVMTSFCNIVSVGHIQIIHALTARIVKNECIKRFAFELLI
jgi:hypothetical protein